MAFAQRIFHFLFGCVGAYLVYVTFAMGKTEEGVWLNRIEELWIGLDDRRKSIGETTSLLMVKVASGVDGAFTKVFGSRLLSAKSLGVSSSLAFASFFAAMGVFLDGLCYLITENAEHVAPEIMKSVPLLALVGVILLILGAFTACIAAVPIFFDNWIWGWVSCIPASLLLYANFILLRDGRGQRNQYGMTIAFAVSVASDLLLIVLVRQSLSWILARPSLPRLAGSLAMQAAAFAVLFLLPYRLPILWFPKLAKTATGQGLFVLAIYNFPTAIACGAYALSLTVVLGHRITWPFLSGITLILTRNDVLDKRKTVRSLGFAMLGYSVLSGGSIANFFIEKILK